MSITTKIITMRQGNASDFQSSKMVSGELAIVNDAEEMHFSPSSGKAIRVATEKDVEELKKNYTALLEKMNNLAENLSIEVNVDDEGNATLGIVMAVTASEEASE